SRNIKRIYKLDKLTSPFRSSFSLLMKGLRTIPRRSVLMKFWFSCNSCRKKHPFRLTETKCGCGGTVMVEYDLEKVSQTLTKESLKSRGTSMWRYKELLPVESAHHIISLGEGWTPLVRMKRAEKARSEERRVGKEGRKEEDRRNGKE